MHQNNMNNINNQIDIEDLIPSRLLQKVSHDMIMLTQPSGSYLHADVACSAALLSSFTLAYFVEDKNR